MSSVPQERRINAQSPNISHVKTVNMSVPLNQQKSLKNASSSLREPALLSMLKRIYASTSSMRTFRETILMMKQKRSMIRLPDEYVRYWHGALSACIDPSKAFNKTSTADLADRLGDYLSQTSVLADERYRTQTFLKKFILRLTCAADRVGALYDDRLVALADRSGCFSKGDLPTNLASMTPVAINALLTSSPLRNISTRTNPSVFEKLRALMTKLEPKDAQKAKPIVDKLQRFLFDEYDKVLVSYGGSTGKIPTLYEASLMDRKALDPLLSRISDVVKKSYLSELSKKITNTTNANMRNKLVRERTELVHGNKTIPALLFSNVSNRMALASILRKTANMATSRHNQNIISKLRTLAPHIQALIDIRRKIDTGNGVGIALESAMRVIQEYRTATDAKYTLFRGGDYPGVLNLVDANAVPRPVSSPSSNLLKAVLNRQLQRT